MYIQKHAWKAFLQRLNKDYTLMLILTIVLMLNILRNINLPGVYMDAVNPDYIAAVWLAGGHHPVWLLPSNGLPPALSGVPYHGLTHLYLELPVFWLLGTNITSLRICHGLFALGIVLSCYMLIKIVTGKRWIAFLMMICLAFDPAFLFAFRTQAYITTAPLLWSLLAAILLWHSSSKSEVLPSWSLVSVGFLSGLSFYGYFIYLFIAPASLWLVCMLTPNGKRIRSLVFWGIGFLIGCIPYIYGYAIWAFSTGSINAFLIDLRRTLTSLDISTIHPGFTDLCKIEWTNAITAISDKYSQLMMFSDDKTSQLNVFKAYSLLIVGTISSVVFTVYGSAKQRIAAGWLILVFLCYFIGTSYFASRVAPHHFFLLLPFIYISIALVTDRITDAKEHALPDLKNKVRFNTDFRTYKHQAIVFSFFALFLVGINCFELNAVHRRLVETGGIGKFSDASSLLAEDAIRTPTKTHYIMQEWGFFMPFAFLTGGRVSYSLEANEDIARHYLSSNTAVSLVLWCSNDVYEKIAKFQTKLHVSKPILKEYRQRDGRPAFVVATFLPIQLH